MISFKIILLIVSVQLVFAELNLELNLENITKVLGKDGEEIIKKVKDGELFAVDEDNSISLLDKRSQCECRIKSYSRIVGGQEVARNSIPWQVSLASGNSHFCGGSIINSRYILSAQHCTNGKSPSQIQVRVGLHRLTDANPSNTYSVRRIHNNQFNGNLRRPGDIVILELSRDIQFIRGRVEPGCLNLRHREYPGELVATGWGTTTTTRKDSSGRLITGRLSPVLKKAHLFQERCETFLICVNSRNGDSICQGDSGGPLHYTVNGRTSIEGVASFVTGVRRGGDLEMCTGSGAYSRNAYYNSWFHSIVGSNYCSL